MLASRRHAIVPTGILLAGMLAVSACAEQTAVRAKHPPVPTGESTRATSSALELRSAPIATELLESAPLVDEHWYFESLSSDGKRALLRQLDPSARTTYHVRVVEVESGRTLEEATLRELARVPASTIGGKPTELAALEWMLASPSFARDVVKGGRMANAFPFGECGRLAAASNGSTIAFDAGDWLYVADEAGHVRRRLVDEAAYDPRFTPDGKYLFFRRATGTVDHFAKYELFVVPSDLSAPPRLLPNTAGMRDRFIMHPDGQSAFAIASQPRAGRSAPDTCVVSLSLKPPFAVKRLACLEGSEQVIESVISPKGKWAALTTKKKSDAAPNEPRRLEWRRRVMSLTTGKVVRDEPEVAGLGIRAISDSGLLVESGALGVVVEDIPAKTRRDLTGRVLDLGYRGFFRNDKELVYVSDAGVSVIDVAKD